MKFEKIPQMNHVFNKFVIWIQGYKNHLIDFSEMSHEMKTHV